jgi:HK97 family phage major capsid protein
VANIVGVGALTSSITTSRDVVRWPKVPYSTDDVDNSALAFTWEDDEVSVTSTDPTPIGSVSIPVKKGRFLVLVDRELIEDSAIDVIALLSSLAADKIAVERDRVVTVGAGGKRPEGFMINGDITTVNSGVSGAFTMDGIFDLVYNLPEQYADDAQFMCKRLSMGLIRKLKDAQGRYLWEPSTQIGTARHAGRLSDSRQRAHRGGRRGRARDGVRQLQAPVHDRQQGRRQRPASRREVRRHGSGRVHLPASHGRRCRRTVGREDSGALS